MTGVDLSAKRLGVLFSAIEVLAIQGNLVLALRHPENQGPLRVVVLGILESLTEILLREGVITAEFLKKMQADEEAYGSPDVARVYSEFR